MRRQYTLKPYNIHLFRQSTKEYGMHRHLGSDGSAHRLFCPQFQSH